MAGSSRTAALLYHGHHFRRADVLDERGVPLCSDFFASARNQATNLLGPLRMLGFSTILTFFHSFRSGCPARDEALVQYLQPGAHRLDAHGSTRRIVDSYISAIDIFAMHRKLQRSSDHVSLVVLLRFDLWFLKPLHLLNFNPAKANIWVRDLPFPHDSNITSDLLFLLPVRYLDSMRDALNASGDDCHEDGTAAHAWRRRHRGCGHYTFNPLAKRIGAANINFLEALQSSSTVSAKDVCTTRVLSERGMPVALGIQRQCPRNACMPAFGFCYNGRPMESRGCSPATVVSSRAC